MGEPWFRAAGDNAGVLGFVQKSQHHGFVRGGCSLDEQSAVDVPPRDARHLKQAHTLRGESGQPLAQGLRHTGRDLGVLV